MCVYLQDSAGDAAVVAERWSMILNNASLLIAQNSSDAAGLTHFNAIAQLILGTLIDSQQHRLLIPSSHSMLHKLS